MTSPNQASYEQPSKVIYDLGANIGADTAYYLKKQTLNSLQTNNREC